MNVPKLRFKEFTDEWKTHKLKDLCSINPKTPNITDKFYYIDLECVHNGKLKYIQCINKADAPSRAQRVLSPKDIIFQSVRAYQKNSYFFKKENDMQTIASTGYAQLRTKKDNPVYIYHYLYFQKFIDKVNKLSTGTSYPAINSSDLGIININVPTFTEQTKIANFLSTVDKKISNLEDIITNLEKQKKGLLQQIFNQEIRFKDENGNNYPDWKKKKLGDISNLITKGTTPPNFNNGNINFIKVESIINAKINLSKCMSISENIHSTLLSRSILKENDILFAIAGSLGITCIVNKEVLPANTNQALAIIRLSNNINVNYIFWILNSSIMKKYIKISHSIGAQPNLNLKQLNDFILPYPCIEEQTKIADFLSAFDHKIDNQKAQLEHWKQIKKGLLQQMFV